MKFGLKHTGGKRGVSIIFQNRDSCLGNDGTGVEIWHNVMDGTAVDFYARFERFFMGMEAAKGGEKGGVNIEQAVLPLGYKVCPQNAHESGQTNKLNAFQG